MKRLFFALSLILLSKASLAEPTKTVFSPFTGKLDYITRIDSNTIIPGSNVNVSCTNGSCTVNSTAGGGGTTVLPLPAGDTSYIQLTNTLQSGATFFVSSGTVAGQLQTGTFQGANLSTCGSNSQALSWTAGSFGCQSISGLTTVTPLPAGDTTYIQNRTTDQGSATTFFVDSGTVAGPAMIQPPVTDTANQAFGVYGSTNENYVAIFSTGSSVGTSPVLISTGGWLGLQNGSASNPSLRFWSNNATLGLMASSISIGLSLSNAERVRFATGTSGAIVSLLDVAANNSSINGYGSGTVIGTNDVIWVRDASGQWGDRQGTNPQQINEYNTWTSSNSFERAQIGWKEQSNLFTIDTTSGPTAGSQRNIAINQNGTASLFIGSNTYVANVATFTASGNILFGGNLSFTPTTKGIVGTTTNDAATAGNVGEFVSSCTVLANSFNYPISQTFGDLVSMSLTAGDWVTEFVTIPQLGTATGFVYVDAGISTTTGNSSVGLSYGDNQVENAPPVTGQATTQVVPGYRLSVNTTTTVYGKISAKFGSGQPTVCGCLKAWRVR